ncbi:hypothetical protein [Rubinisphaera italica]|uniref:Lipoprotein n=1 Tax=Rubinisphaera italica TaxID=2527969 RepID=A0A5C5XCE7_9PLAN|nr:hypothetical protein [Rubinisphaera italica]TWT60817.1 hypothetical protein Pan54_15440 [Rubinisphaera italica]
MNKAILMILVPLLMSSCSNRSTSEVNNPEAGKPNTVEKPMPADRKNKPVEKQFSKTELYEFARFASQSFANSVGVKSSELNDANLQRYTTQAESALSRQVIPLLQNCVELSDQFNEKATSAGLTEFLKGVNAGGAIVSFTQMLFNDDANWNEVDSILKCTGFGFEQFVW